MNFATQTTVNFENLGLCCEVISHYKTGQAVLMWPFCSLGCTYRTQRAKNSCSAGQSDCWNAARFPSRINKSESLKSFIPKRDIRQMNPPPQSSARCSKVKLFVGQKFLSSMHTTKHIIFAAVFTTAPDHLSLITIIKKKVHFCVPVQQ